MQDSKMCWMVRKRVYERLTKRRRRRRTKLGCSLAKIYETCEDADKRMLDVEQEVEEKCDMVDEAKMVTEAAKEAEEAAKKLRKAREMPRNVAKVFNNFEEEVNEVLADLKTAFVASTSVTSSWVCVTWDRAENEMRYFEGAFKLLKNTEWSTSIEDDDVFAEVTVEDKQRASWCVYLSANEAGDRVSSR